MLNHLTQEIRHAVVGANQFTASYGLVVTWYSFAFDGSSCSGSDCPVITSPIGNEKYMYECAQRVTMHCLSTLMTIAAN